jgi:hypothetical protein
MTDDEFEQALQRPQRAAARRVLIVGAALALGGSGLAWVSTASTWFVAVQSRGLVVGGGVAVVGAVMTVAGIVMMARGPRPVRDPDAADLPRAVIVSRDA